eukprot:SAG11_NODE_10024_length_862_cov_1.082569_1_plen_80_part_10
MRSDRACISSTRVYESCEDPAIKKKVGGKSEGRVHLLPQLAQFRCDRRQLRLVRRRVYHVHVLLFTKLLGSLALVRRVCP